MALPFNPRITTAGALIALRDNQPGVWHEMVLPELMVYQPEQVPLLLFVPGYRLGFFTNIDLEAETYGQSIDAADALEEMKQDDITARLKLLAIYFQPAMDNSTYNSERISEVMDVLQNISVYALYAVSGYLVQCYVDIVEMLNKAQKKLPFKPEEKQAGMPEMEKFGALNTLMALAKGSGLQVEEWTRQSWGYVNSVLLYDNHVAWVQRNLQNIYETKQKQAK